MAKSDQQIRSTGVSLRLGNSEFLLAAILFLILGVLVAFISYFLIYGQISLRDYYLLPYALLLLIVTSLPALYLMKKRRFSFFHPLVYASWSYFIPAFVFGSLYIVFGSKQPYYAQFIVNPERTLPLTLIYLALGFLGLILGYSLKPAARFGNKIAKLIPDRPLDNVRLLIFAIFLVFLGGFFSITAFSAGAIGYQYLQDATLLGATISFLAAVGSVGSFWIWHIYFGKRNRRFVHKLAMVLSIVFIIFLILLEGNRATLLRSVIAIAFAFHLSGRRIRIQHSLLFVVLLMFALLVGMIYGTTFREIKGDEQRAELSEYFADAKTTVDVVSSRGIGENFTFALDNLFRRLENVNSLAVIVSHYKQFRSIEASYGLDNNIWRYTWTAVIPRIIWPDKPSVSGARDLGELYFDYGGSSPTITPIGDLLRNFGPWSIPFGMMLLGAVLRIIRSVIEDGKKITPCRAVLYYMLLTAISYEGFYGTIFPIVIRTAIVVFAAAYFATLFSARKTKLGFRYSRQPVMQSSKSPL